VGAATPTWKRWRNSISAAHSVIVSYENSVHGIAHSNGVVNAAVCTDCHGSHDLHRSTNPQSKLYWQNIPATCGKCHDNVRQTYIRSIHGKAVAQGMRDAPVCTIATANTRSGGETGIVPGFAGQHSRDVRPMPCRATHRHAIPAAAECVHHLYPKLSRSGLAGRQPDRGQLRVLSRRPRHPARHDPLSTINPNNLPQTCGKCHPGIGTRLSAEFFRIHAPPGAAEGKPWIVNFISRLYIALIALTIGGMAMFVAGLPAQDTRPHSRRESRRGRGTAVDRSWRASSISC
jgi:hypothetical protein